MSIAENEGEQAAIEQKVSVKQFFGIEINFFASEVAKVALQIAKCQMDVETAVILNKSIESLPLESTHGVVCANALTTNWEEVLAAKECNYIIGNPPFVGANNQTKEQKLEVQEIFKEHHHSSLIDYVACWYKKAANYMRYNKNIHAAFVSTNSICQGEQVVNIWKPLFANGLKLSFAHKNFRWTSEAKNMAHVFVNILGFEFDNPNKRHIFNYETPDSAPKDCAVENINAYIVNAKDVFIERKPKSICKTPKMTKGCQPTDGGNLIIEADEIDKFLFMEPNAKRFIKKLVGSREFIQQKPRFCLWLVNATAMDIKSMPEVKKRVKACRDFRLSSPQPGTRKLAERPSTFRETYCPETCLIVPSVCSERRRYIPIGYVDSSTISTNANLIVPDGSKYMFGILQSTMHNAWMRVVAGRLKSDYRYSAGIVYNNFIWPGVTKDNLDMPVEECVSDAVRKNIEECAQAVLNARAQYTEQAEAVGDKVSLADMYDPDNDFLFPKLTTAHKNLDAAVEAAYGVDFKGDEEKIVAHLFGLYAAVVG